jgi:hypothetical protein
MEPADIAPTYPLIRTVIPSVTPQHWRRFATPLVTARRVDRSGIIVASGSNQFPCGLVSYRIRRDLACGQMLQAEHFIALNLLNTTGLVAALLSGLEEIAATLGVGGIRSTLYGASDDLIAAFLAAGHDVAATVMSRLGPVGTTLSEKSVPM